MKYILRIWIALVFAMCALIGVTQKTYAIPNPDTTPPDIKAVYVYQFSDGSLGVLVDYLIDYAVIPAETAAQSFIVSFVDTDGTTQLKAVTPYVFVDSGYGRGVAWIPFTTSEVTSMGLTSVNTALYRIWLIGNPTVPSGWTGVPPKQIATIDQWYTTGDMSIRLALDVLSYAEILEVIWSQNLVDVTSLGNRLTTLGQSYFENVIPNLRTLAPSAFSAGMANPNLENINYAIGFGGNVTSGTSIIIGSPVTLAPGNNTIVAGGLGNFTISLLHGTAGTITNGTGSITSSPSKIVEGTNTITVTVAGNFVVNVNPTGLAAQQDTTITGTGMDVTSTATTLFGTTRGVLSTVVWLILGVVLCAVMLGAEFKNKAGFSIDSGGSKLTMTIFGVWMIAGVLVDMIVPIFAALTFIGYGAFVGYILFFRNSGGDIGKVVTFMGYMWIIVCLAGGILEGIVPQASTTLTASITSASASIPVASTNGFRKPGILVIGNERIAYFDKSATSFDGTFWKPLARGVSGSTAQAHSSGDVVRMPESSLINDALDYNIALLSDASGLQAFVTVPLAIWDIITSFIFLPWQFLGTDAAIITYIWGVIGLGLLVSLFVALAGGRKMA